MFSALPRILTQTKVKRFQIRFAEEEDYHEAMKWFARAKIPTEDAGYLSLQRPDTARSTTSTGIMPSDSVSQIATCPPTASTVPTFTPSHTPHTAIRQQHTIVAPSGPSIQQIHQAACDPVGRSNQTANQPEFQHNPITPMRPGLVENTYFAPVNTTGTIGCLNVATPLINMYQPRPSTAPQLTRQPLSEILPPKPHFAFLGPPPVKDLNHEDSMAISETSHQTPVEMENELCSQASNVTTQATSPSKTKRPRTKSTTKPKAPKRPRNDTSNLVTSPPKAQDTQGSTIPSIDDILVRSADSQLPTSIPARPELDNQVLLEKAAARTTRGESDLHSRLLPSEVPASQPGQADTTVVEDNFSNLSTAINQSGANSNTRSAIDLSNPYAPAPPHPFDPDTLTILPRNTIPPNMTTTPIPLTSLPRNQQDVLLGSYIKTLFKDPSFLTMCQMMENSPDLRRLTQTALRL